MVKKRCLLTPGPAPIPEKVMKAMARPIIHHRTQQYRDIAKEVNESLKKIFKTKNNVLTLTSSGTGAMEASIVNTLSPGDTAIVVRGGKFGERFAEICSAYGVKVVPIDIEWGTGPEPGTVDRALRENPAAKAVFIQLCETSTATVYRVKDIGDIVGKTDAILVTDAISGLGADEFKMDEWGVDVALGGSQKAFMIPPGLSFVALSKKAMERTKKSTLPRYYCDLGRYEKLVEKGDSPWTPAITLVIGLREALSMMAGEGGVDGFVARHGCDAEFVRKSIVDMGLSLFSRFPSNAVTAVQVPDGTDGAALIAALKEKGITFAGGQGRIKGKIFRIAHMGAITNEDLKFALDKLKETLGEQKCR